MKLRAPEQAGFTLRGPLEPLGRARCWTTEAGGEVCTLLRLPRSDPSRSALRWGMARGIGALLAAGEDDEGAWFVRGRRGSPLDHFLETDPPLERGLLVFSRLARLLEQSERKGTFVGPLLPEAIDVDAASSEVALVAEDWVRATLGAPVVGVSPERRSLRFFPPSQAAGAAWDESANRYVFGLLLYEFLAGEPAFAGRGLRLALEERAERAPAAFDAERARNLPPGLQSLCLRLLEPDPARRPSAAREIVRELSRVTGGRAPEAARVAPKAMPKSSSTPSERAPAARRQGSLLLALPLGVALGLTIFVTAWGSGPAPRSASAGERRTLSSAAGAGECESCHPRHTAEWRRSVMAHAATSPLFQALEQLITEQVGKSRDCPDGAGILRPDGADACKDRNTGLSVTGSGGEGWCSNCHLPKVQILGGPPEFRAGDRGSSSQRPLADLVTPSTLEGIGCVVCHQATGPVSSHPSARAGYAGNPFWTSFESGRRFDFRPEAARGLDGISNSGSINDPRAFALVTGLPAEELVPSGAHRRSSPEALRYQRSSEFCGSCHDVRLFGTDVIGRGRGEHFKRLRNAYSEWAEWRDLEQRKGRVAATCVDCHLSTFPGICVEDSAQLQTTNYKLRTSPPCPPGTRFERREPGSTALGFVASNSRELGTHHPHYFTGVDVPLDPRFDASHAEDTVLDVSGLPLGVRARRDLLLASAVTLKLQRVERRGARLSVPVIIENVGAGHRVPAGFSQERELWVELTVRDARGALVYEVGRVTRGDEDLRDKLMIRVNTDDRSIDAQGRPLGLFGADVRDGPDVPRWSPPPELGGNRFRGRGLVNFQNGFLRCVKCIGRVAPDGSCQALPGQEGTRAARYDDARYDADTGECSSNLVGRAALFETYFPVGALDASRGITKAPDAIIDTRSLAPEVPVEYVYELDVGSAPGPFRIEARLLFRAFPPYLLRAFIDYERRQAGRGLRPSGPLIDERALERLEVVEIARLFASGGT